MITFDRAVSLIQRHRRWLPTMALVLGFVVDIITFRNLDLGVTEIILAAHLTIVAGSIIILSLPVSAAGGMIFGRVREFISIAQQYSTGNLLSAFLVLYSASGSLAASWPFFVLVLIAAVGNETLRLERYRLPFHTTLLCFNLMLFASLAVPLAFGSIGTATFFVSVWVALGSFVCFVGVGRLIARRAFIENAWRIRIGWVAVLATMLGLYVLNLIPPIPLSIKDAGFYHSVVHRGDTFVAEDEARGPLERFLDLGGVTLHLAPGEPAYAFSAVFAPARFGTMVIHRWEQYDSAADAWVERDTIRFSVTGGRHEGYRLYSLAAAPAPGRYRVSVETGTGAVIGRIYLTVARVSSSIAVQPVLLD